MNPDLVPYLNQVLGPKFSLQQVGGYIYVRALTGTSATLKTSWTDIGTVEFREVDGVTVLQTISDAITYSGIAEVNRTRTIF